MKDHNLTIKQAGLVLYLKKHILGLHQIHFLNVIAVIWEF